MKLRRFLDRYIFSKKEEMQNKSVDKERKRSAARILKK